MSDRLLIPLGIPLTLGFIGGVIVAILQLGHAATIAVGVECGAVALVLLLAAGYGLLLARLRIFTPSELRGEGFAEFHKRRAGA